MRKCIRGVVVISNTACITNKREMGDDAQRTEKNCKNQRFKLFYNFFFVMASVIYEEEGFELHQTRRRRRFHPSIPLALMFLSLSLQEIEPKEREKILYAERDDDGVPLLHFINQFWGGQISFFFKRLFFSDLTHKGERGSEYCKY